MGACRTIVDSSALHQLMSAVVGVHLRGLDGRVEVVKARAATLGRTRLGAG